MKEDLKDHWEAIYQTKQPNEVSWTQEIPSISLEFIHKYRIARNTKIMDIGGGDSKLVDCLLAEGFSDITVLDISPSAIQRAKDRLGNEVDRVKWIVGDVLEFNPSEKYGLWHDRAAFHFQTDPGKIHTYLEIVKEAVDGMVIIGTFSVDGPNRCSGLEVKQYDEGGMKQIFEASRFRNVECKREDHITPSGSVQNFVFCSFRRSD